MKKGTLHALFGNLRGSPPWISLCVEDLRLNRLTAWSLYLSEVRH